MARTVIQIAADPSYLYALYNYNYPGSMHLMES
jgi:hypothetical protein